LIAPKIPDTFLVGAATVSGPRSVGLTHVAESFGFNRDESSKTCFWLWVNLAVRARRVCSPFRQTDPFQRVRIGGRSRNRSTGKLADIDFSAVEKLEEIKKQRVCLEKFVDKAKAQEDGVSAVVYVLEDGDRIRITGAILVFRSA